MFSVRRVRWSLLALACAGALAVCAWAASRRGPAPGRDSEAALAGLVGRGEAEVVGALGQPYSKTPSGPGGEREAWHYLALEARREPSPRGQVTVSFGADGKVSRVYLKGDGGAATRRLPP